MLLHLDLNLARCVRRLPIHSLPFPVKTALRDPAWCPQKGAPQEGVPEATAPQGPPGSVLENGAPAAFWTLVLRAGADPPLGTSLSTWPDPCGRARCSLCSPRTACLQGSRRCGCGLGPGRPGGGGSVQGCQRRCAQRQRPACLSELSRRLSSSAGRDDNNFLSLTWDVFRRNRGLRDSSLN